ncbi:MAG: phage portal protein [Nitrosomonas sp.]|uniref:phage portal protein n=1 Tax=Nitrosomonas sp. TaxID=42353 RepID=UPI0025DD3BEA|nr:phage portal protein [Nitrosomonas sp.]MBY0474208.1 phage portal protein [Nitrosomonas sp.]
MSPFKAVYRWFGFGGNALGQSNGVQVSSPSTSLVEDSKTIGTDSALQISSVWRAVEIIAKTVATLPLMVYESKKGMRELARDSDLWNLFHESPNARMTPAEFWTAMMMNLLLRGNAYARIDRSSNGNAYALWPMPADQVDMRVNDDGTVLYYYSVNNDLAVLSDESVLHLKEMGNGTTGLSRLEYMRATTTEASNSQSSATKLFTNGGKPTGILMVDKLLNKEQRAAIQGNFSEMASGSTSRLFVLEADMKYQQINLTPEDMQLLDTRRYGVEEIGRWFGVPGEMMNAANVSKFGSGVGETIEGFHKFTLRPCLVSIEQAIRKRILTSKQRVSMTVEFNLDALLRSSLKDRMEIYAKGAQNGIKTRNECRQLENDPPIQGGDGLTVQSNLIDIKDIGKNLRGVQQNVGTQDTIAQ